ncbi:hypothetical protein LAH08_04222 [Micromonospora noduli]|uniref:Uncharacterized protein n=1 Tax=Micromonospora noduli TaxID=709876 RepID=A0A328N6H1_9ACTN|nr:hypothetical protein LAH08_04222 [Micromonospora noduli]
MTGREGRSAPKVPRPEGGAFFVVLYSCDVSQHPQCVISGRMEVGKPGLMTSAIRLTALPFGPRDVRILPLATLARVLVRSLTHEAGPILAGCRPGSTVDPFGGHGPLGSGQRAARQVIGVDHDPRALLLPALPHAPHPAAAGRTRTVRGQRGKVAGGTGSRRPLLPDPSAAARAYPSSRHHGMSVRGSRRVDSEVGRLAGRNPGGHRFSRHVWPVGVNDLGPRLWRFHVIARLSSDEERPEGDSGRSSCRW